MTSERFSPVFRPRALLIAGLLIGLAAGGYVVFTRVDPTMRGGARTMPPPVYVIGAHVVRRAMPFWIKAVGQVVSRHSVSITPQVSGLLTRVYFHQGQYVHRGERLFEINPAPYRAAVAQARAAYLAAAAQAQRDAKLVPQGFIAPQTYITAKATAAQDKALLTQAEINLGYTLIRSPIDGLAGEIMVRAGNVVGPSTTTPLVTINQMSPILVSFQLPQRDLDAVLDNRRTHVIEVQVLRESVQDPLGTGPLVFVDNTVYATTGTFLAMARVANVPVRLWPGEYVAVRVVLAVQPGALVVRQSAVQPGQGGDFVYVVAHGHATIVPVTESRQIGSYAVLSQGPPPGSVVVAHVPRRMRDGVAVHVEKILPDPPPRPWS